ncbi:MAG TPA: type I-C CRISPR-associated protein Cas8c/Csd1 [Longimicrobiales bacterium]
MILEALYDLAVREELLGDPDYELKPVAWLVRVDDGGRLLGIEGTHGKVEQGGERKKRPQPKSMAVPRQPIRTSGDLAFFLCDKAEYALGIDPEPDPEKRRSPEKLAARFALFRSRVATCLDATADPGIRAVAQLLERIADGAETITLPVGSAPNDLFAFVYAPDVDRPVHDRPAVRAYWKAERRADTKVSESGALCMVTGEPAGSAANFPLLKKVPGGTPSGVSLVSFNANAFESHGWRGNANAPISRSAAEAIATALNRLLHPAFPDPRQGHSGGTLPRRHFRLSADSVVCFWASDRGADDFVDDFAAIFNPSDDAEPVSEVYRSLWRGRRVEIVDASRFYALTLTGTQGRAIIRDWFESSVADVANSLADYFADIDIVRNSADDDAPPLALRVLLAALAPISRNDAVPAPLATHFVHAALRGAPFPIAVLQKAIERSRAEIGRNTPSDRLRRDARAALIKAVLHRNFQHEELTPAMDPTNTEPGYLLGRLMAVLERLQQAALGMGVNATVVDRFFGAASATPQAVFPRLLKNARHHARKAGDEAATSGLARWLEREIDDILAPLGVKEHRQGVPFTGFPAHLSLEQQGLFVLGYHQQRHWLRMSKQDRERAMAIAAEAS